MSDRHDTQRPQAAARAARAVRVEIGSDADDLAAVKTGANPAAIRAIEREALVLGQLHHPNVVELLRTERTDAAATLVTQFAGRNTLADFRPVDAATVGRVGASLLTIIGEIHRLGWVHARLVPEHCIIGGGGRLTLCAFGAAHRVAADDPRCHTDLVDALAIVTSLADHLEEPHERGARRRWRELRRTLDVDRDSVDVAGIERIRVQLSHLGGAAATVLSVPPSPPSKVAGASKSPATSKVPASAEALDVTAPARRSRTAPARPRRNWRGAVGTLAAIAGLFATIAFLRWIGGPIGDPLTDSEVSRIGDVPPPVTLAFSVVRVAAFAACLYGIALATATLAAILTHRPDIEHLATMLAPPRLRRFLVGVIGLGVLSSVAVGPTSPSTNMPTSVDRGATTTSTPPRISPTTTLPTTTTTAPGASASADPLPARPWPGDGLTSPIVPAMLPDLWVMEPGDHLWRVASVALARRLGREASSSEIDAYWRAVVDLNRESLIDPDNPDLVFAGQVIELPPFS